MRAGVVDKASYFGRRAGFQTRRKLLDVRPIPTGWNRSAQGCEERATLGTGPGDSPTLKGLHRWAAFRASYPMSPAATLSGLTGPKQCQPRVARSSQPWADGCNPFGIESLVVHTGRRTGGSKVTGIAFVELRHGSAIRRVAAAKNIRALSAFTLIELVISSALMALILVSAYLCLTSGLASRKLIESRAEAVQNARVAMALLSADLRCACPLSK